MISHHDQVVLVTGAAGRARLLRRLESVSA
jgi:hypothetical protein